MKKGFTLIELLAVIVILAVIAVIATPIVLNVIEKAKEGALKDSAYGYMSSLEYYVAQSHNDDSVADYDINGNIKTVSLVSVKGTAPTGVNLKLENGKVKSGSISYGDYAVIIVDGVVSDITQSKVTITLVGDEVINHPAGTSFTDPGATAYDLIDEDITSSITTEGTVDINTIGTYTITYNVENSQGIAASKTRTVNITDSTNPVITITGNNPYTHQAGSNYTDAGATASDNVDGNITSNIKTTSNVVATIVGTYEVTYTVSDANGNTGTATRTVNVVDTTNPTVGFSPNGDATYKKTNSTTVTVSDNTAMNTNSFKYLWSTSSTGVVEGDFTTSFTNGDTISTPSNLTGSYYLWIIAKDSATNTTITKSNVFNLDNTAPTAGTMSMKLGSSTGSTYTNNTWTNSSVWVDEISGTDTHSGHASTTYAVSGAATIASTSSANTLTSEGTYTITVTTTDNANNTSTRTYTVKIDKTAPVITLTGNGSVNYVLGIISSYSDAGATASDNIDGNLTSNIVTVIPSMTAFGTYYVTYNVSDSLGNAATQVTRKIVVNSLQIEVLAIGAGGGAGGSDASTAGSGGASGGGVYTKFNSSSSYAYNIAVGGGGQGGGDVCVASNHAASYGIGGTNGGGNGGLEGSTPCSGGGGGGGGYSSMYLGSTYYAVAGGGAGGGGANEGNANDLTTYAGGNQPNGNTGSMNGFAGANYSGDGGGYGGGGGGWYGGNGGNSSYGGQGGGNYYNSANITGTTYTGNNGSAGIGGSAGGNLSVAVASNFNYSNNYGGGGSPASNVARANSGNGGIVIIRYYGSAKASGGTITSSSGYTIHTFTSNSTFTVY